MTAAGEISFARIYFRCRKCSIGTYGLDERLGIDGRYSPQAQRLACLAAASWSYDRSAEHLLEFCGMSISDNTIREIAEKHGRQMSAWQRNAPEAVEPFCDAEGDVEFTTDGTSVNTMQGWREMKVALFAKRKRGDCATPEEWATRSLPKPHVSVAFAAIEKSSRFGSRWKHWRRRLHIQETSRMSVLADGARWIWDEQEKQFPGAEGVLDIFHAIEHVAATAKTLFGEGTSEAKTWTDSGRSALLHGGWDGIVEQISETKLLVTTDSDREALRQLEEYLLKQADHLYYKERLAEGRSIGSGQIEGACKNLIGRRLKQTGARWKIRRVNRIASLCSLVYSDLWNTYWTTTPA